MRRALTKSGTWNIPEHSGTSNNYNNYEKIFKMTFSKLKLNRNKLVSAWNMKKKSKNKNNKTKKRRKKKRKMEMTAMSEGLQLIGSKLIHSFQSFTISSISRLSHIHRFRSSEKTKMVAFWTLWSDRKICLFWGVHECDFFIQSITSIHHISSKICIYMIPCEETVSLQHWVPCLN